jgi:hypothetical protein
MVKERGSEKKPYRHQNTVVRNYSSFACLSLTAGREIAQVNTRTSWSWLEHRYGFVGASTHRASGRLPRTAQHACVALTVKAADSAAPNRKKVGGRAAGAHKVTASSRRGSGWWWRSGAMTRMNYVWVCLIYFSGTKWGSSRPGQARAGKPRHASPSQNYDEIKEELLSNANVGREKFCGSFSPPNPAASWIVRRRRLSRSMTLSLSLSLSLFCFY